MQAPPKDAKRWGAARERVIYGVNHAARSSVRDLFRETRFEMRTSKLPVDPWLDSVIAGRSGNHYADFMARFASVLHTAGRCPHAVRATLRALADRVADRVADRLHPRQATA